MKRLLAVLALALAVSAHAAEDGTISLSPAVITLRGDFGQSTTQTLKLINGTSRPFSFDLVAKDVVVRDGKRVFVDAGELAGSIAATAVFSQPHVDVQPGETVAVKVTVTLPSESKNRAIVALFRGTNKVMSGHVPMTASLGTLLTFSISDAVALDAAALEITPQSATSNLAAEHLCTNSGSEPFVAKGVLAVLDAKGALIGKAQMKPQRLLPGESAQLGAEYAGELDPGRYRVMVTYEYEGKMLTKSAEVDIR